MQCLRCGKEMSITTGGNYNCPNCGVMTSGATYDFAKYGWPLPHDLDKQEGWICPVCGRGVAPWVDYCPCQGEWKITYGTTTGIDVNLDLNEYIKEIYKKSIKSEGDINEENVNC